MAIMHEFYFYRESFRTLEVQEGMALAEGGVELGEVWGLVEEKDWASKLNYLSVYVITLQKRMTVCD